MAPDTHMMSSSNCCNDIIIYLFVTDKQISVGSNGFRATNTKLESEKYSFCDKTI